MFVSQSANIRPREHHKSQFIFEYELFFFFFIYCLFMKTNNRSCILTPDEHDTDAEHLLGVGVWRDVTEADRREAAEGEVERRDVLGLDRRPAGTVGTILLVGLPGQLVQPASRMVQHWTLHVADGVPVT